MKYPTKLLQLIILITMSLSIHFTHAQPTQMIAEITTEIETEFGIYKPYPVQFDPKVPLFSLEPDLSNVQNLSELFYRQDCSSKDSLLLLKNHFTVKRCPFKKAKRLF